METGTRGENLEIGGLEISSESIKKQDNPVVQTIPTKCFALGGIEEIGKNCYCIEHDDEILVIDIGVKFVNKQHLPGLSGVIPTMDYLKKNQQKLKALIISHGHEDHIGGIVHALKQISFPVIYTPIIAAELIKRKLDDNEIPAQNIVLYSDKSVFATKHFMIDFYRVNHSIPDSFGVSIMSPNGLIVCSGDFRFDFTSRNDKVDLYKIGQIAQRGVDLLMCESTNAEQPGFNDSEKGVINELHNIMSYVKGRIIITFFASNIGRVEEVFKIATSLNKKIVILGHSIDSNISASQRVGYLKFDSKTLISSRDAASYPDDEILIICTGSQGEETSALSNISKNKHPHIKLKSTDTIIFSSNVIPGNTYAFESLINRLCKSGCEIHLNTPYLRIHSSGHAAKLEQQLFVSLIRPNFLMPIHGETRMLKCLYRNCVEMGFDPNKIFVVKNGDVVHLLNREAYVSQEKVDAFPVYIDGNEVTASGEDISKARSELGNRGYLFMHIFMNGKTGEIYAVSPLVNAGSYFVSESNFSKNLNHLVQQEIKQITRSKFTSDELRTKLTQTISKELYDNKKQKPIVEIIITDDTLENITSSPILPKDKETSSGGTGEKEEGKPLMGESTGSLDGEESVV
ncbi:ribonuclease J-like [Rattus rattus]|uniref:ribonuclease J-like n=1 Tax=Rattus rattus TaxID=10117 RepID=UPI0013F3453B|nr:ribonuclease J-like [Rattus rattus]